MADRLELSVLGRPRLQRGEQPLTADFISAKGQALLIFLAVTRQTCSRSALAGLLWGEMPEEDARANLRLTLTKLRKAAGPYLIANRQSLAFNFDQPYWLDLTAFEAGLAGLERGELEAVRAAVGLYRGDFLDDFQVQNAPDFETWLLAERERLRQMAIRLLTCLVEAVARRGDLAEGIDLTRRLLALEPWHEEAHRQLMEFLAAGGQRSAALAQYETCRRLLAEELGLEPAPATSALYERLKAGEGEASPALARRSNLPPPLTPFIGREAERTRLAAMLADPTCRLLTLVGPGGIGKTRLAVAAAEAQAAAFAGGAWFVSLAEVAVDRPAEAAELLLTSIAQALALTFSAQQPLRDLLLRYLADKKMLLLLDNLEHLLAAPEAGAGEGVWAFLQDLLHRAPGVKLLITSRARLGLPAEWVIDVEGLPYPPSPSGDIAVYPAVQLFAAMARRIKPDFDLDEAAGAVQRICQLVQGSPLGLELAANWVRTLPCVEIAARLETNLDLLATAHPDVTNRHQSMRAVLDHSWNLLSQAEQQVFSRLAVFKGGLELAAAEGVAGANVPVLAGLVDKSLLRLEEDGRYRLHELVRQYAAEKLAARPDDQQATRQRYWRYYAEFLEKSRPALANKAIRASLDREIENLRAAWEWVQAEGEPAAVAAYSAGLWAYYRYKGWYQEAIFMLEQAQVLPGAPKHDVARWHHWIGEACYQMGRIPTSQAHLEQALAYLGQSIPHSRPGWLLRLLAEALRQSCHRWRLPRPPADEPEQKRLAEQAQVFDRLSQINYFAARKLPTLAMSLLCLNRAEQAGTAPELAVGYGLGTLLAGSIPLPRLAGLYDRLARQALEGVDDLAVQSYVLEVLGLYHGGVGHWAEAEPALEQAAAWLDRLELPRWWSECRSLLGKIRYYQGDFSRSSRYFNELLDAASHYSDLAARHWALIGQTECALRQGQVPVGQMLAWLDEAQGLPANYPGYTQEVRFYGLLALVHLAGDQPDQARQAAQTGLAYIQRGGLFAFWALEGYAGVAETFLTLAEATSGSERTAYQARARQAIRAFFDFAHIYPIGRPRAWLYQGRGHWLAGQPARAQQAWRRSLAAAQALGMLYEQARARYELGRCQPDEDQLLAACRLFTSLGALRDLAHAQAAREGQDALLSPVPNKSLNQSL